MFVFMGLQKAAKDYRQSPISSFLWLKNLVLERVVKITRREMLRAGERVSVSPNDCCILFSVSFRGLDLDS